MFLWQDTQLDKVDGDKDMKQDLPFFSNKHSPQNQMMDPARISKSVGIISTTSSANSRKFGARDEVTCTALFYVCYLFIC